MSITLISLPKPYLTNPNAQVSLGILYIASILKEENIDVDIKNYSSYSMLEAIDDLEKRDLYGISITSMEIPYAEEFASLLKKKYENAKIIVGGPGVIDYNSINIDSIFYGEAEKTIIDIVRCIENGGTLNKVYLGAITNVNNIPFPARDMVEHKGGSIFIDGKNYFNGESTTILTSRGCPFNCAFCASPYIHNRKVRWRDINNVIEEVHHIVNDLGIHQFRISDDNFISKRKRTIEFCKGIKDLNVAWRLSVRSDSVDKELLEIMKDAGCKELSFGVESFDNAVLKKLNKKETAIDHEKALNLAREVGLKTRVLMMIATPGQTKKTIDINKSFLKKVPYDLVSCTTFVPMPGSDIWFNSKEYGVDIINRDLHNYNMAAYDSNGRIKVVPLIKVKNRSVDALYKESEEFRDWLEKRKIINHG